MSRHFTFDCHEDYSEAAHIEALLLLRGGRILDAASGVALAMLEERLVVVRLEGPRSGRYAMLSKIGPGRLEQLSDRRFLEWVEGGEGAASARRDQHVVDLTEGEARLREIMQAIQEEVVPQVSALIAARAQERPTTEEGGVSPSVPPSRAACFGLLATFFDMGGYSVSFPRMAGIVHGLLKDVPGITFDLLPDETGPGESATAHLILATPGNGKTRSVVSLIEALPAEAVVAVFQPTLIKAAEFARDMAASSRPVHVFRGRGAPVQEGASERMCRRHAAAAELAGKGYPVKSLLCGSSEPGAVAICPHAAGCAYLAQMKALKDHVGGGVFILTHASLTQLPAFPAPHLVIVDEDPSAGLPQAITVEIEALGMAADWATLLPDDGYEPKPRRSQQECDCEVSDETEDATPDSVMDLLERLRDGLACPAPLQEIATGIMVEEIETALKMLRGLERKLRGGLIPGTFGTVNAEQIVASDPDTIIVTGGNWEAYVPGGAWVGVAPGANMGVAKDKLGALMQRPAFVGTKAVKNGQVHAIWHQFYNNPYSFVAVQQIAKWLHPDLFADLDPEAALKELHARFLPVEYKLGYWVSLN